MADQLPVGTGQWTGLGARKDYDCGPIADEIGNNYLQDHVYT